MDNSPVLTDSGEPAEIFNVYFVLLWKSKILTFWIIFTRRLPKGSIEQTHIWSNAITYGLDNSYAVRLMKEFQRIQSKISTGHLWLPGPIFEMTYI